MWLPGPRQGLNISAQGKSAFLQAGELGFLRGGRSHPPALVWAASLRAAEVAPELCLSAGPAWAGAGQGLGHSRPPRLPPEPWQGLPSKLESLWTARPWKPFWAMLLNGSQST